jgi:hypothetical protein
VIGLAVNLLSAWLLHGGGGHGHDHAHGHHDLNLRAAYLHVLADALTSVLAIVALAGGRAFGWDWLDPVMGSSGQPSSPSGRWDCCGRRAGCCSTARWTSRSCGKSAT